jgi:hypothetical protein
MCEFQPGRLLRRFAPRNENVERWNADHVPDSHEEEQVFATKQAAPFEFGQGHSMTQPILIARSSFLRRSNLLRWIF